MEDEQESEKLKAQQMEKSQSVLFMKKRHWYNDVE